MNAAPSNLNNNHIRLNLRKENNQIFMTEMSGLENKESLNKLN